MPRSPIEGQSVNRHKFEGEEKTRAQSGGPPGSESRKRDRTIGQGKKFEKKIVRVNEWGNIKRKVYQGEIQRAGRSHGKEGRLGEMEKERWDEKNCRVTVWHHGRDIAARLC